MTVVLASFCAIAILAADVEPEHSGNALYRILLNEGLTFEGETYRFPQPILWDEQSAEAQEAALVEQAGSKARAADLLRDSVSAPFLLKLHDVKAKDGSILRAADLWFALRADLENLEPDDVTLGESQPVEAGNMRFEGRLVPDEDLKARGITPPNSPKGSFPRTAFLHSTARLLDRLHVESTARIVATRSKDSLVVASRTDPAFRGEGPSPNVWRPLKGTVPGPVHPYEGGGGYVKISRYKPEPGVLLVEAHFVFDEPQGWFQGAPILRSKIGLVAQDQIRSLRRERKARESR